MDDLNSASSDFNTLKEDPVFLSSLLFKYVKVEILKNVVYSGYLESIDPLHYSIVLNVLQKEDKRKVLIPGHAILNVTVQEEIPDLVLDTTAEQNIAEDILKKKQKTILWLEKNLLPVSESGENIIVGNAKILPPYSEHDICIINPMVVSQLRKTIVQMPNDI
ncbi:unnamed protein product [Leptosia nina]|uniref:AD domain-containing protein n=1 Tax=Leptosia nina TaxID=320188 RepID=A0AAV1JCM5_9NEOP